MTAIWNPTRPSIRTYNNVAGRGAYQHGRLAYLVADCMTATRSTEIVGAAA